MLLKPNQPLLNNDNNNNDIDIDNNNINDNDKDNDNDNNNNNNRLRTLLYRQTSSQERQDRKNKLFKL